jgi:hypothetical protein
MPPLNNLSLSIPSCLESRQLQMAFPAMHLIRRGQPFQLDSSTYMTTFGLVRYPLDSLHPWVLMASIKFFHDLSMHGAAYTHFNDACYPFPKQRHNLIPCLHNLSSSSPDHLFPRQLPERRIRSRTSIRISSSTCGTHTRKHLSDE